MSTTPPESTPLTPFAVRDCALLTLSTGVAAENLKEFHEGLQRVPESSVYHHFWGRLLRPQFDEPEYSNDFASWAYRHLREKALAERLSMVDPTEFDTLEALRQELLEVVEQALDENPMVPWLRAEQPFAFLRSQIIVLDSGQRFATPREMAEGVARLPLGSVYYHFIDARRRTENRQDDLSVWVDSWGPDHTPLCDALRSLDPYFSSLKEIRRMLACTFARFFDLPGESTDLEGMREPDRAGEPPGAPAPEGAHSGVVLGPRRARHA